MFLNVHFTSGDHPRRGLLGPSCGIRFVQTTLAPIMRLLQKMQFSTSISPWYQLMFRAMLPEFTNAQFLKDILPVARFCDAE